MRSQLMALRLTEAERARLRELMLVLGAPSESETLRTLLRGRDTSVVAGPRLSYKSNRAGGQQPSGA